MRKKKLIFSSLTQPPQPPTPSFEISAKKDEKIPKDNNYNDSPPNSNYESKPSKDIVDKNEVLIECQSQVATDFQSRRDWIFNESKT